MGNGNSWVEIIRELEKSQNVMCFATMIFIAAVIGLCCAIKYARRR